MRKINIIVLLAITSLFLNSCEENDDTNYVQQNYLSGKWIAKEFGGLNAQGIVSFQNYVVNENCFFDDLTFNEDGSFLTNDFEYIGIVCNNTTNTGAYSVESNVVTLNYTNIEGIEVHQTRSITSLTYTEMVITYTDSETNEIVFIKFEKAL